MRAKYLYSVEVRDSKDHRWRFCNIQFSKKEADYDAAYYRDLFPRGETRVTRYVREKVQ